MQLALPLPFKYNKDITFVWLQSHVVIQSNELIIIIIMSQFLRRKIKNPQMRRLA